MSGDDQYTLPEINCAEKLNYRKEALASLSVSRVEACPCAALEDILFFSWMHGRELSAYSRERREPENRVQLKGKRIACLLVLMSDNEHVLCLCVLMYLMYVLQKKL